jgi:hypothetical protein
MFKRKVFRFFWFLNLLVLFFVEQPRSEDSTDYVLLQSLTKTDLSYCVTFLQTAEDFQLQKPFRSQDRPKCAAIGEKIFRPKFAGKDWYVLVAIIGTPDTNFGRIATSGSSEIYRKVANQPLEIKAISVEIPNTFSGASVDVLEDGAFESTRFKWAMVLLTTSDWVKYIHWICRNQIEDSSCKAVIEGDVKALADLFQKNSTNGYYSLSIAGSVAGSGFESLANPHPRPGDSVLMLEGQKYCLDKQCGFSAKTGLTP